MYKRQYPYRLSQSYAVKLKHFPRIAFVVTFGLLFQSGFNCLFYFCKTFHAPGRSAERGIAAVANRGIPFLASCRNLMDRRTGDVIFPGQQSNAYVFCVMPPINLLSLLGGEFCAFVDVHFRRFLPGRFPPATLPGW